MLVGTLCEVERERGDRAAIQLVQIKKSIPREHTKLSEDRKRDPKRDPKRDSLSSSSSTTMSGKSMTRQDSGGYSAGLDDGKSTEQAKKDADMTWGEGNPLHDTRKDFPATPHAMAELKHEGAAGIETINPKTIPTPGRPDAASMIDEFNHCFNLGLLKTSRSQLNVIMDDFVPVFQSVAMIEGEPSIQKEVDGLYERLKTNLEWNAGELMKLDLLVNKIRVIQHGSKNEHDIQIQLEQLKPQYESASKLMERAYEAKVALLKDEGGRDRIVEACNAVKSKIQMRSKCLQSATHLVALYQDALAIHDDRLWTHSKATLLSDVHVGMSVTGTIHKVERVGKVIKIPDNPAWSKCTKGPVTIEWEERQEEITGHDGKITMKTHDVFVEKQEYRFSKKPFEAVLAKYNKGGVRVNVGPIKKLYRLVEKMLRQGNEVECAAIHDVVRASLVCASNDVMCGLLKELSNDPTLEICKVKEGYSHHQEGAWLDIKFI